MHASCTILHSWLTYSLVDSRAAPIHCPLEQERMGKQMVPETSDEIDLEVSLEFHLLLPQTLLLHVVVSPYSYEVHSTIGTVRTTG